MFQRFIIGILVTSCLLLAPTLVSAQAIGGSVTDSTGAVLPGVVVEVRSPALIEQVRTAVSDGAGEYLIIALEPGIYSASFVLPGFRTFVRDGIELVGEATATVDGQLQVGSVDETITVSGAAPLVDIQNVQQQAVMTREVIDAIPTGKAFNNLGVLVPGMVTGTTYGVGQDVGGQSGQSHQRMAIHGGSESDQRLLVDGMSMSPWTQEDASLVWFSDGNFEEVQIDHSVISAESELGGVRFNMIPRSGGNTFSSRNFFNFTTQALQADNLTPELTAAGLPEPNRVKELWSLNPSVGGPILRDRLWFFGSYTRQVADSFVAFYEDVDPNAGSYTADLSRQAFDDQNVHDAAARITWQATDRDKVQFYFNENYNKHPHFLIGSALAVNVMPSAAVDLRGDSQTYQATWTSSLSNRLLLEVGVGTLVGAQDFLPQSDVDPTLAGILEVFGDLTVSRGIAGWFSSRRDWIIREYNTNARASMSYVTGSHSAKFGTTLQWGNSDRTQAGLAGHSRQINFGGQPISALFSRYPVVVEDTWDTNYMRSFGLYAQDQWTLDRLSINAGVRFDYFRGGYPDHSLPATTWGQASSFSGQDVATWKDLSPRLGLVYDLTGDGRTALKVTANRYVDGVGTTLAGSINPALQNSTTTRSWYDGLGLPAFGLPARLCYSPTGQLDFGYLFGGPSAYGCVQGDGIVQGDPLNNLANGELFAGGNGAFGQNIITTFWDDDWAFGWGKRFANWEFSGGVQHELMDGVSVNVSYFRRLYVNYSASNNRAVGPNDYDPYCVTVPNDPRLPTAGQQLCGLFQVQPEFQSVAADRITTFADNFGTRTQHWNGVDLTVNARMDNGLLLQGGVSTGKTSRDQCDLNAGLNNPSQLYCKTDTPFITQVKLLGSYTLPYDVQISGTLQSLPGREVLATVTFTGAEISESLGRPSNTSSTDIQVIEPGSTYSERLLQLDLRATKNIAIGPGQYRLMVDVYNVFNDSTPLELNNLYGATGTAWQRPALIIPGRLLKFAFQIDF